MPRAPHSSALLAGRPLAKRSVFSISMSRTRSMPLSSDISTRLTRGTGTRRPSGCHTKASADVRSGCWPRCGARRSSALAIRSRTSFCANGVALAFALAEALPCERGFVLGFDFVLDLAICTAFNGGAALSGTGEAPQAEGVKNGQKCPDLRGLAALQLGLRPL